MKQRPLPATIDDVSPDWLNTRLVGVDEWLHGSITSVTTCPAGGRDALASDVFTMTVETTNGEPREPTDLIVKLHHPIPEQRDDQGYAAEVFFYSELASRVGMSVPRTYIAEVDETTRRLIIVQELLSDGVIGSSDEPLRLEELGRVLESLVALHSQWWQASELKTMAGIRQFDPVIRRAISNLKAGTLDVSTFNSRFRDVIRPEMRDIYASMADWMDRVADGLSSAFTLIHLDCSAKNIFIPNDRDRLPVLFDWALFRCGNPALDVATLLCYSMDPYKHNLLPNLARHYHDMLTQRGIADYPFNVFWDDFRYSCLWRLAAPVYNAAVGSAARTAHARAIIPLLDSAVLHTNAVDLLDIP